MLAMALWKSALSKSAALPWPVAKGISRLSRSPPAAMPPNRALAMSADQAAITADFDKMSEEPSAKDHMARCAAIAKSVEPIIYDVVISG